MIVDVLIPARDAEATLPSLLRALRPAGAAGVRDIYVIDNGSADGTARVAVAHGAKLLSAPRRGYGAACLRGVRHLSTLAQPPEVVLFLDGDQAGDPGELARLLQPFGAGAADPVIGSRTLEAREGGPGLPERVGTRVATGLIRLLYGQRYSDLGPSRAISWPALVALGMRDDDAGWTVEMLVKAARIGMRIVEVPVRHRRGGPAVAGRRPASKALRSAMGAGYQILYTILRHSTAR